MHATVEFCVVHSAKRKYIQYTRWISRLFSLLLYFASERDTVGMDMHVSTLYTPVCIRAP
jgi:hypothetical protein